MSNFRVRTKHARKASLLASAAALALGMAGPALAQAPSPVPQPSAPRVGPVAAPAPGVPFSAIVGASPTKVSPPPSNQPMAIDGAAVDRTIQGAVAQADARVQTMDISHPPAMDLPNMAPIRGELDTLTGIQRSTRLLEAKRLQAEMAAKLWVTVFDPAKEKALADAASEARGTGSPSVPGAVASNPSNPTPATPVTPTPTIPQIGPSPTPIGPVAPVAAPEPPAPHLPYPKVVQIIGTGSSLRATLLVPYVGEVRATVGSTLPGGRRVTKVSALEVMVSDKSDGNVVLGFGSSVPLAPPPVPVALPASTQAGNGPIRPGAPPVFTPPPIPPVPPTPPAAFPRPAQPTQPGPIPTR